MDGMTEATRSRSCDVLVIGSGAGGLATAVTAAALGLEVIVAEKEPVFGGTTAWSGGWLWVPRNPVVVRAGIEEDAEAPRTYLRHILGNRYDAARVEAFLEAGPRMIDFFERETAVRFLPGSAVPDFHGNAPGAVTGGRSVVAAPYDGRELGSLIARLRRPIPETTLAGMAIASGADLGHFLRATRSAASFAHVAKRLARHALDLARHRRSMQLVNGNALAARLLRSAADRGVTLWHSTAARQILRAGDAVTGAILEGPEGRLAVTARCGVVLATGGFPHDPTRQKELFPHVREGTPHHSAAPATNTGDGLRLAEAVGGQVDGGLADSGAWAPVSLVPRADGTTGRFPHLIERGKPGIIAVTRQGRRFVNESGPYHDFMRGLFQALRPGETAECWLVCDHRFLRRYGLGAVKPAPLPLSPWLRNGYLKRGGTIEELAAACGIDAAGLRDTLAAYNSDARQGLDTLFARGSTPFQRGQGDAHHDGPNPCIAPIEQGPFYAVRIVPGSLGTFAGLVTDAEARVLDARGQPIPGLYAAGNDLSSVMGGQYPSGGITLGPAMTFGWIAARHMAGRSTDHDTLQVGRNEHAV